jgi:Ca2+-binding EF-hand superfamily protein
MMQDLFKTMDLDDVGKIRWDQARVVMAKMGRKLTDDQFAKLVDRYDLDKNGAIHSSPELVHAQAPVNAGDLEFSEFCSMYLDHMKRRIKNNDTLLEVFAFLDRHEHGRVSREDVRKFAFFLSLMRQALSKSDFALFSCFCDSMFLIAILMVRNTIQVKTCLEIANIQLPEEDLDVMLQSIGLDDDGTVSASCHYRPFCVFAYFYVMISSLNSIASVLFRRSSRHHQLMNPGYGFLFHFFHGGARKPKTYQRLGWSSKVELCAV